MVGSEQGRWDLELRAVTPEDAGRYQCQVLASPGSPPLRSSYATVTVTSLPEPPLLTSGPALTVKEASTALVQCISRGGRPPPTVSWTRNGALLEEEALPARVGVIAATGATGLLVGVLRGRWAAGC